MAEAEFRHCEVTEETHVTWLPGNMGQRLRPADSSVEKLSSLVFRIILIAWIHNEWLKLHSYRWDDDFRKQISAKIKYIRLRAESHKNQSVWFPFLFSSRRKMEAQYSRLIYFFFYRLSAFTWKKYISFNVFSLTYHIDRKKLLLFNSSNYAPRWMNIVNLLRSWKRALFSFVPPNFLFAVHVCSAFMLQCAGFIFLFSFVPAQYSSLSSFWSRLQRS